MDKLEKLLKAAPSRRSFLAGIGAAGAGAVIVGCSSSPVVTVTTVTPTTGGTAITDADVLNFALNLEYLEAEFYLRAATGSGIPSQYIGANPGAVTGGTQVSFAGQPVLQAYANEIAQEELNHVIFLRTALGTAAVDRPAIDFTDTFNAVAQAAKIGQTFNPFNDPLSFLVGAFVFEDVGVTAYHGGALLIQDKATLGAAAAIHAVEAYHAAEIRGLIAGMSAQAGASQTYIQYCNAISAVRGALGGNAETALSISINSSNGKLSTSSIVACTAGTSIGYERNTDQVLHIVYATGGGAGVSSGGFFPSGMNGTINTTAS